MESQRVKILSNEKITQDVLKIVTEKPSQYIFRPGQATDISIDKDGWRDEKKPFTFTSLPDDDFLEFTIKTYPSRNGITNQLLQLEKNDGLILYKPFGDIRYRVEGVFIAGGAGVTPFLSIFRYLHSIHGIGSNKLIFANKTRADIIQEQEFRNLLGNKFINILSDEVADGYAHGMINADFLGKHINSSTACVYLCGPPPMMDAVEKQLAALHIAENVIIKESF